MISGGSSITCFITPKTSEASPLINHAPIAISSDNASVATPFIENPIFLRSFTKSHDPGKWGPAVAGTVEEGETYNFLKEGQRVYWLDGELALLETEGKQQLSRPIASIRILEATHFLKNNKPYTSGKYKIIEVFDPNNPKINFEWMKRR